MQTPGLVEQHNFPASEWDSSQSVGNSSQELQTFALNNQGIGFCAGLCNGESKLFCAYLGPSMDGVVGEDEEANEQLSVWCPVDVRILGTAGEACTVNKPKELSFNATGSMLYVLNADDSFFVVPVESKGLRRQLLATARNAGSPVPVGLPCSRPLEHRRSRIVSVQWHPLESHALVVLSQDMNDECAVTLGMYSAKTVDEENSGRVQVEMKTKFQTPRAPVAFSFVRRCGASEVNWEIFSLYVLLSDERIVPVCPFAPLGTQIKRQTFLRLLSQAPTMAREWLETCWRAAPDGVLVHVGGGHMGALKPCPQLPPLENSAVAERDETTTGLSLSCINVANSRTGNDVPTIFVVTSTSGIVRILINGSRVPAPMWNETYVPSSNRKTLNVVTAMKASAGEKYHIATDNISVDFLFLVGSRTVYVLKMPWIFEKLLKYFEADDDDGPSADLLNTEAWAEETKHGTRPCFSCSEASSISGFRSYVAMSKRKTFVRVREGLVKVDLAHALSREAMPPPGGAIEPAQGNGDTVSIEKVRFNLAILNELESSLTVPQPSWPAGPIATYESAAMAKEHIACLQQRVLAYDSFQRELERVEAFWDEPLQKMTEMTKKLEERVEKTKRKSCSTFQTKIESVKIRQIQIEKRIDLLIEKMYISKPLTKQQKELYGELNRQQETLKFLNGSMSKLRAEVAGLANSAQAKSKRTGQDDDRAIPRQMLQQVSKDLEDNLQDLAKWSARVDGLEKTFARSGALPFDPASGSKTEQKIDTRTSGELQQSDLTSFVEEDDIGW